MSDLKTDITPATDEQIAKLEQLATISDMCGHDASVLALIARIRSEREQAARECAEIAATEQRKWAKHSNLQQAHKSHTASTIREAILTLIERGSK